MFRGYFGFSIFLQGYLLNKKKGNYMYTVDFSQITSLCPHSSGQHCTKIVNRKMSWFKMPIRVKSYKELWNKTNSHIFWDVRVQCWRWQDRCVYHPEYSIGEDALWGSGRHLPDCQNVAYSKTSHGADRGKLFTQCWCLSTHSSMELLVNPSFI